MHLEFWTNHIVRTWSAYFEWYNQSHQLSRLGQLKAIPTCPACLVGRTIQFCSGGAKLALCMLPENVDHHNVPLLYFCLWSSLLWPLELVSPPIVLLCRYSDSVISVLGSIFWFQFFGTIFLPLSKDLSKSTYTTHLIFQIFFCFQFCRTLCHHCIL